MTCQHRFYHDLIPNHEKVKFLIIGTFNPSWDAVNGNNANYFYGRGSSLFWCICPHAFMDDCLIDKGVPDWIAFCERHGVGLTDIIKEVTNANEEDPYHKRLLTVGFEDKNLDLKVEDNYIFNIEFNSISINQFITERRNQLKGVFFSRKSGGDIPRIWNEWLSIRQHCNDLKIPNSALPSPSIRGGAIRGKILIWREEIQNCI